MKAFLVFFALALFAMASAQVILNNPDPGFYRPTYEQPDISPAWAPNPNGPPSYPPKPQRNPLARGG